MLSNILTRFSTILVAYTSLGRVDGFAPIGSSLLNLNLGPAPADAAIDHRDTVATTRLFTSPSDDDDGNNNKGNSKLRVISQISVTANNGRLLRIHHHSQSTNTDMTFSLFLPSSHKNLLRTKTKNQSISALYWLSGLTCDDTNFSIKAGAFEHADREGIALVIPDTSPRGEGVANDEGYDLGHGAGFYVDATEEPWEEHYKMYEYVTRELPRLVEEEYGVGLDAKSIFGHSMGE